MLPEEEVVCPGHGVVMINLSPVATSPAQRFLLLPGTARVTLNHVKTMQFGSMFVQTLFFAP